METAKILIADDEEAIVKMVERVLKKKGSNIFIKPIMQMKH